jgi:hypothetical protein
LLAASSETANGEDLVYVAVELYDADGTPIYVGNDDRQVRVRMSGAGTLAGIGNGNPIDIFQLPVRRTQNLLWTGGRISPHRRPGRPYRGRHRSRRPAFPPGAIERGRTAALLNGSIPGRVAACPKRERGMQRRPPQVGRGYRRADTRAAE